MPRLTASTQLPVLRFDDDGAGWKRHRDAFPLQTLHDALAQFALHVILNGKFVDAEVDLKNERGVAEARIKKNVWRGFF